MLFRGSSHSDVLEVELRRRKIPFVKYGGLKFLEAAHVKDLLAVLRWADNPRNTVCARSACCSCCPGMGPANARKAIEHFEAQTARVRSRCRPSSCRRHWACTGASSSSCWSPSRDPQRQWAGQLHLVREWYKPHFERIYEHFHMRIGDLDQLELLCGQYPSRERFLTELTLDPPERDQRWRRPAACRRGLPGARDDRIRPRAWSGTRCTCSMSSTAAFPSEFATGKPELIEEERRLLYVAHDARANDLYAADAAEVSAGQPVAQPAMRSRTAAAAASSRKRC